MKIRFQSTYLLFACILYFLLLNLHPAHAQIPDLHFKHLSVEDGLSQSTVRVILQDKMGFMWFGTDLGLNKYDASGVSFYQYNAVDSLAIASNYIVELFEDSYGTFWIGNGFSGLNRFDRGKELFYRYVHNPDIKGSISNNNIRAIFEDSQKNLWIGTAGGGLNLYDRKSDSFSHFYTDSLNSAGIGSNYISSIAEDKNGYLWLGSPEGILIRYDAKTKKGQRFNLFGSNVTDRSTTTFGQVYIDSENNVWFSTETGLFFYDQLSAKFQHFVKGSTNKNLNENAVTSVFEYEKGIYLIATDHGGINIYNKREGTFTYHMHSKTDESTISNDQLYTIYQSGDGIIWIGNFHGGVNILDTKSRKFPLYQDLVNASESLNIQNSVLTICEDKDNRIWLGYDGQGIDIIDPKTGKLEHLQANENNPNSILSNSVVEIYKARNDDIWIGTYLKGMSKLNWKTRQYTHYQHDAKDPDGIGGNNVWSILEDKEGLIWIGFQGNGLDRFDEKANKFIHYRHDPKDSTSLSINDVYKVFQDNDGNIWVGTRNGLCLLNKSTGRFTRFMSGNDIISGIFGSSVYDIYQDSFGNLWIGTDQALNLYNPENKTFKHFQEKEGLKGNAVLSITSDKKNNLWISTNKGLSRFNIEERKFRNYDIADGLQGNEFNYVSVLSSSEGKFYFGGKNGFNVFYPDSIIDNPKIPPVYFTKLTVLNTPIGPRQGTKILSEHINFEKKVKLTYKQSVITFEFAALNYSNPQKNQYAYWLEGFDKGWNFIGNKHDITYTNLNPGKYLLRVKGSNNDGIWNEEGASLQIIVLPPWWKTWWFKIIFYLSIIGFLLLFYYLRLAFYQSQQKKLLMLVRERTFQLEEVAVTLEEKQEEINSQNEELMAQKDELENSNSILIEQKQQILEQNKELDGHRNRLESLVEERTKELIEAKDKAEESDKLKSSFLANLSHEIRTPLNAILGFSTLLGEKDISDQEREDFNRIIHGSSNTLLDLISDILDISKIEAGQMELNLTEVSLEAVVNDLVGIFDMFIRRDDIGSNKPVLLKVAIEDELLKTHIITDNLRLTQVISNLINNAIKFTSQGYIEVGCTKLPHAEMLEFYVKDTGVGIKEENQQLVFERFRKVEEDKTQLHRGTGLGLSISYQLVNLLGGSMYLTSKIGEGSVFYFTIPLIKTDSHCIPVQRNELTNRLPDFKNHIILVAEDDIANYNYIEKLLRKAKAKVIHAVNGKQVLKILQNCTHDIKLILMDIKMPEMDGIETLHEIRKMNISIPVIAQTAYALADEIVKLKKEGFDEYISKPIQREYLYYIIEKLINPNGKKL
jgi:signal transduction histidine kinase/ligand-binding sensor domain-containing protein